MKIIHKNRLSFRDLLDICKISEKAWDYTKDKLRFLSVLGDMVHSETRKYNTVYLAINNNGDCVGYLTAFVANKTKVWHPCLAFIYLIYYFISLFYKDGRRILAWRHLYHWQKAAMVKIGKQYLAGKDYKKISEGLSVAIFPEYRKQGVYREMTRKLIEEVEGYYIFHTSTESDYRAHETMGYKKIFEAPYFYPEKETTFIMYGERSLLKL